MSKHIDGMASEKMVRSGHWTQGHPDTIPEVKRILFEHAKKLTALESGSAATLNK